MSATPAADGNSSNDQLVVIKDVVKKFDDFVAVERMDLTIRKGEFLALMGPSGCGKTTTLRMLAGIEKPTEGTIHMSGKLMNDLGANERDTPMVWQSLALFPFLNVRKNVEFGLKMRGMAAKERSAKALEWLERLGIGEFANRDVSQLSGGQRQRVALARALVTEPEILLLDEPLSALDAHLVIRMQGELTRLQRELGITFVYVTHSQSEAFAMADRVVIMDRGRIAQIGAPRDIYRAPANRFVAEFVGRNNILSGTVDTVDDNTVMIDTPIGLFSATAQDVNLRQGDPATLVVSADLVTLSKQEPATDNKISCALISEEFVGSFVTLFLEAADGTELKAEIQQRELEQLDLSTRSDALWLGWSSDRAHVLAETRLAGNAQARDAK